MVCSGISASRLELLEDRLKSDILAELAAFDSRILLHNETDDGQICAVWETVVDPSHVKTLREVMDGMSKISKTPFQFHRIPITAEKAPDFIDVKALVGIVSALDEKASIIVNCQLGKLSISNRGRFLLNYYSV